MPLMAALCPCKLYLSSAVKNGKLALKNEHRRRIRTKQNSKVLASVDFDDATRPQFPEHARWDYLLEVKVANAPAKIIAVEFHSVDFSRLLKKHKESKEILVSECDPVPQISEWILISEGNTGGIALMERRKLNQKGITTAGRALEI